MKTIQKTIQKTEKEEAKKARRTKTIIKLSEGTLGDGETTIYMKIAVKTTIIYDCTVPLSVSKSLERFSSCPFRS